MNSNFLSQLLPHLSLPNEIYFKKGSLIRLKFLSQGKILLFTGKNSLKNSGALDKIYSYIKPSAIAIKTIPIDSEPNLVKLPQIANKLFSFKPNHIIACGGGSVLDSAKIIKILLANPKLHLESYIKPHSLPETKTKIKLIAIPTTASGAEVSWTAPVIEPKSNKKLLLVSSQFLPDSVILDPELTLSLSPKLTALSSLDAFTHALESYSSTLSNHLTNQYAVMSGSLIHKFLLPTLKDPNYLEGKEAMQSAAMFASIAQNITSVGAIHALSHALGGLTQLPHSKGNVIFLPSILKKNSKHSPKPTLFIKEIGFNSLANFFKWFEKIKQTSNLESSWSNLLKSPPKVEQIAQMALEDVCIKTNPYKFSLNELIKIIKETK